MNPQTLYVLAADIVLLLHFLFVIFIILGLALIFVGNALAWIWVRNPWFRLSHLVTICIVVLQSWLDLICPLTSIEMALRTQGGDAAYSGTFISHWLENILYYHAPPWVFVVGYTIFGTLVVASWFLIRPRHFSDSGSSHSAKKGASVDRE